MTENEWREKIANIILEWKDKATSIIIADQILALIPKQLSTEEIEKIIIKYLNKWALEDGSTLSIGTMRRKELVLALSGHIQAKPKKELSACCEVSVRKQPCTTQTGYVYICNKCNRSCDLYEPKEQYCECKIPKKDYRWNFCHTCSKPIKPQGEKIEELVESGLSYKQQDIELVSKINEIIRAINKEGWI